MPAKRNRPIDHHNVIYLDYQAFDEQPDSHLYCLSDNTIQLAYELVRYYGLWRNRYVQNANIDDRLVVTDEQFQLVGDWYDQALKELKTPMCDELNEGLTEIANAIKLLDTGHGHGGGCTCAGGNCYGDDPAPAAAPQGNESTDPPPAGFDTWAEFNAYKCRAANKLADDLIQTVYNMSSVPGFVAGLAGGALYALLQTSLLSGVIVGLMALGLSAAGAVAVLLASFVALIAGGAGMLAYFTSLANAMTAEKDALVCELYNAGTVEVAQNAIRDFVTDLAGDLSYGDTDEETLFTSSIADIITALTGTDVVNSLFEEIGEVSQYVGSVDCTSCNTSCSTYTLYNGTLTAGDPLGGIDDQFTITATHVPSTPVGSIYIKYDCDIQLELVSVINWSPVGGQHGQHNIRRLDLTTEYAESATVQPPVGTPFCGAHFTFRSANTTPQMTVTFKIVGYC